MILCKNNEFLIIFNNIITEYSIFMNKIAFLGFFQICVNYVKFWSNLGRKRSKMRHFLSQKWGVWTSRLWKSFLLAKSRFISTAILLKVDFLSYVNEPAIGFIMTTAILSTFRAKKVLFEPKRGTSHKNGLFDTIRLKSLLAKIARALVMEKSRFSTFFHFSRYFGGGGNGYLRSVFGQFLTENWEITK